MNESLIRDYRIVFPPFTVCPSIPLAFSEPVGGDKDPAFAAITLRAKIA